MDIVVIGSTRMQNEKREKAETRRTRATPGGFAERRRNRVDRRRSVRDGVSVSLSYRKERRKQPDRRRTPGR